MPCLALQNLLIIPVYYYFFVTKGKPINSQWAPTNSFFHSLSLYLKRLTIGCPLKLKSFQSLGTNIKGTVGNNCTTLGIRVYLDIRELNNNNNNGNNNNNNSNNNNDNNNDSDNDNDSNNNNNDNDNTQDT